MKHILLTTESTEGTEKNKKLVSVLSVSSVVKFALLLFATLPQTASACAVCFGNSDSPWAKALSWGIIALLAVVLLVLGGIVAFFIHMAKRARMTHHASPLTQEDLQP